MRAKREAFWNARNNPSDRCALVWFKRFKAELQKECRRLYCVFWEDVARKLEKLADDHDTAGLFESMKVIYSSNGSEGRGACVGGISKERRTI